MILHCFKRFYFGEDILKWIKLFYNDISSIVINNGNISQPFNINRGVRQGCPLSSLKFIICIELLSNYIETNENKKEIQNLEIKQTLFADDATYFNNGDKTSLAALIEILNIVSFVSGLCLNINKTTILRVGSLKNTDQTYFPEKKLFWTNTSAKTLGIHFLNNANETLKKLTILGKVIVIKTFALPKIIYPLSVLSNPPKDTLSEINSHIFKYIWENKPDKIKRSRLKMPFNAGGLNVPDIFNYNS